MTENKNEQGFSLENQRKLERLLSERLNPDGNRPQIDSYISSTLNYLRQLAEKMENATDRHQTAEEISKDLTRKLEAWASQRK